MTIVTLDWDPTGTVAFGPRGARYEISSLNGLHDCRVYLDTAPFGSVIGSNLGSRDEAMICAQRHAQQLTEQYGAESDAINGASDRPRITVG